MSLEGYEDLDGDFEPIETRNSNDCRMLGEKESVKKKKNSVELVGNSSGFSIRSAESAESWRTGKLFFSFLFYRLESIVRVW